MALTDRKRNWPVVDGEPVKPYALPDDPAGTRRTMDVFEAIAAIRDYHERTRSTRTLTAIVEASKASKGRGFEITLFRRITLEFHRLVRRDGEKFRVELYRRRKWDLNVEFWRARQP